MMDNSFEDNISKGKVFFIKENYDLAKECFVEASKLNSEFVSVKFRKMKNHYKRNDYQQECLDNGIKCILDEIENSIWKMDLENRYNPFNRNFKLKHTQSTAILKDYLLLLTKCLNYSSKSINWSYSYKLIGDVYFNLENFEMAYVNYKKSLYFNKNGGAKTQFKKLVKEFGNGDNVTDFDFKYKLIKNIQFENIDALVVNKENKTKSIFNFNRSNVSVEELCKYYYKNLGFDAIIGENHFWWFTSDIFFHDLRILKTKYRNNLEIYLDKINNRINEHYNSDTSNFVKKYYEINKSTQSGDYIDKLGYQRWFNLLNIMGFEKCLKLTKEILTHNPQILPTSGLPDLIVWNENNFFFVEVKSTNDKLSERQKWWHLYISEELNIPIIIFMVNKNEKQTNEIKKQYLIK